jgi:hypothetical protein
MNTGKDIKKSISYKILIKDNSTYFKIGTIVIKAYEGDILYTPSIKIALKDTHAKEIDHISWHASGRVSIKYSEKDYDIIQTKEDRQEISKIGFQEILKDTIIDYKKLPQYTKKVISLDVVFDINQYSGVVSFNFSIVSGKLIVAKHLGQNVPIKAVKNQKVNIIDNTIRALGHHSGNSDKMLQYSLKKESDVELKTGRQIFICHDMKIKNQKNAQ